MRKFLILLILSAFSLPMAHADFFDSNVTNTDLETDAIDRIELGTYSFADARESARLANARKFIEGVKGEAKYRYREGKIGYYRMVDIIQDLESLVYSMNQHFAYFSRYEQTKRVYYRDESEEYYNEARTSYDRLKGALGRSGRDYQEVEPYDVTRSQYYYPVLENSGYSRSIW